MPIPTCERETSRETVNTIQTCASETRSKTSKATPACEDETRHETTKTTLTCVDETRGETKNKEMETDLEMLRHKFNNLSKAKEIEREQYLATQEVKCPF